MATTRRNELVKLLVSKANDDNLGTILEDFLEGARGPRFPAEHTALVVSGSDVPGFTFTWDDMTTRLEGIGFEFGSILHHKSRNELCRAIALDEKGALWVTRGNTIEAHVGDVESGFETYETSVSDRIIRERLGDATTDLAHLLESILGELPSFPKSELIVSGSEGNVALTWDDMTTHLKELGLAFGDVLAYKKGNYLCRAVGYQKGRDKLCTTSSHAANRVGLYPDYSSKSGDFKKRVVE